MPETIALHRRGLAVALLATLGLAACAGSTRSASPEPQPDSSPRPTQPAAAGSGLTAAEAEAIVRAREDSARRLWTEADARFMTDMIGHHAQAIVMARMAPTHTDDPSIRTLAARIINAQRDEIARMQRWLRDRGLPVPDPSDTTAAMGHGGDAGHGGHGAHHASMPGMLSEAELRRLDEARGRDFDRLFLASMIRHHRGAVTMVEQLFGSYGAAQDEDVFRLATDVNVDQITEINRMEQMLLRRLIESGTP